MWPFWEMPLLSVTVRASYSELAYCTISDSTAGVAQASLAETLLKLNTGLVGIIGLFVTRDDKSNDGLRLDYGALIDLSERTRTEAIATLQQLYQRIIALKAHLPPAVAAITDDMGERHARAYRAVYDEPRDRHTSSRSKTGRDSRPRLARITIENRDDSSHIAMVRPGHRRKKSLASSHEGESNVSSTVKSRSSARRASPRNASPSPHITDAPRRRPRLREHEEVSARYAVYETVEAPAYSKSRSDRFKDDSKRHDVYVTEIQLQERLRDSSPHRRIRKARSSSKAQPREVQTTLPIRPAPTRKPVPTATAPPPSPPQHQQRQQPIESRTPHQQQIYIPYRPPQPVTGRLPDFPAAAAPDFQAPPTATRRRRKPSITPTMYSIATDSTKLGEIPVHKWAVPYDFERMARLNEEAERYGWPYPELDEVEEKKGRFAFLRIFRK